VNRRDFLGLIASAVPAALVLPEMLIPKRTFFLPPTGGWAQPSLAQTWLEWSEQVRPPGVLMSAAVSSFIRIPAVFERPFGIVELVVPEETDAELRARMLKSFREPPHMSYAGPVIADLFPWKA
jgi:hypothetical protein